MVDRERATTAEWFVGRADELRRIEHVCRAARQGTGSVVVVSGEPGIGKTRFCAEAAARARRAGLTMVAARCWGEGGAPPLWPWQQILADLCGGDAARLLGAEPADAAVDADRFARFAAVSDAVAHACAPGPTCIVVDDLHAADAGALLLTRFVARSLLDLPLVLVLSRRRGEPAGGREGRLVDEIEAEAHPIALRHFDIDEATAFLTGQGWRDPPPDLVLTLLRVTGGNPLFLRRIAALGAPDSQAALPGGVRVAIEEALSRLRPETRRVLRASAVLGLSPPVAEAAAVAESTPAAVIEAVAEAVPAGLVTGGTDRFTFTHELVRTALEDDLAPAERLDVHARAASIVAGDEKDLSTDRHARRAHHALAAAPRSGDDARSAVTACRAAAAAMVRSFGYERADELLSAAVDLHTPSGLGPAPAGLLVEWARAALLSGRLGEARARFERAAAAADGAGDPVLFAEAALGLGGHWVNEHRAPVERARVLGLQRAALEGLPPAQEALQCRLAARLAAEAVYDGAPTGPVLDALRDARACGDSRARAEALSLAHHALLAPEHARDRLELADELIDVASVAGHGVLALLGLCWRAVDLFHLGDARAVRALEDLRQRADALACQNILYIVDVLDVMLLIRAGRLEEAEAAAGRCYELGVAVGEADAFGYLGAHTLAIRWIQGRDAEVLDAAEEVAASPTLIEAEFAFRAAAAGIAARAGHHDRAQAALDRLAAGGLAALPRSSSWLAGMTTIAEVAALLGDAGVARQAYDLLTPFADLPVMPSLAVVCLGSTERALGLAALAFDDHDGAVCHLERAIVANERLGNRPLATMTRADLAHALVRRARGDDHARVRSLLRQAAGEAEAMGMTVRAETWRAELEAAARAPATTGTMRAVRAAGAGGADCRGSIRREGRGWCVEVGNRRVLVADLVGMGYLAELVGHPGQPISALVLAGAGEANGGSPHELLDRHARQAYTARARELTAELAEAEADNDLARAEHLRIELDALVEQLETAIGLGGRPRTFARESERARTAVRKAIRRAIDEIDAADPFVAEPLRTGVTTGAVCSYASPPDHPITWSVSHPS